jgi:SAM-dependent methyltransferase
VELAQRGIEVTGVDFAPAAIRYAQNLAEQQQVSPLCHFIQADVRGFEFGVSQFDAAILLYGQLAVMSQPEAAALLTNIGRALRPGGQLVLELLNPDQVDKENSSWWFTDDKGLWGSAPFLHLGERLWLAEEQLSMERYFVVQLETGQMDEIILCDQVYQPEEIREMLTAAGFGRVEIYPAWEPLPLYDAAEWLVYVAQSIS